MWFTSSKQNNSVKGGLTALSFAHAKSSMNNGLTTRSSAPAPRGGLVFSGFVRWRGALIVGVRQHLYMKLQGSHKLLSVCLKSPLVNTTLNVSPQSMSAFQPNHHLWRIGFYL